MDCCCLLVDLIDRWTRYAAEEFPKRVANLSDAEIKFHTKKRLQKGVFVKKWKQQYPTFGLEGGPIDELLFGSFGVYLHNALFFNWSYSAADSERPEVTLPENCLVGRFARPVIYYVAGWIVHSMKSAGGVSASEKQHFFDFVVHNSTNADAVKKANLPTTLVERRKKK